MVLFYALPAAAIVVVFADYALQTTRAPAPRAVIAAALLIMSVLAIASYTEINWRTRGYANTYEGFHYVLGGKYFRELGYTNLYNAVLVADDETGRKYRHPNRSIRDLSNRRYARVERVLAEGARYRALFTPERWEAFKADVVFFKESRSEDSWNMMLRDHGFNGSPVWSVYGSALANAVGPVTLTTLTLLALLDVLLLLLALGCVWWAFDIRVAALIVIMLGSHFLLSHNHLKAAYLRLDWISLALVAVCSLRKRCFAVAGACVALAAMSRIFPVVLVTGLLGAGIYQRSRHGSWSPELLRFFGALAVSVVVLVLASLVTVADVQTWLDYAHKIRLHDDYVSPGRIGFKHLFLMAYDPPQGTEYQEVFHERRLSWWSLQVVVLVVTACAGARLRAEQALALGFVPFFFLTAPTYYYYVMLLVPLLFFAARSDDLLHVVGIALMFTTAIVAKAAYPATFTQRYAFTLSLCFLLVCVYLLAMGLREWRRPALALSAPAHEAVEPQLGVEQ